jgi:hypothetical protein
MVLFAVSLKPERDCNLARGIAKGARDGTGTAMSAFWPQSPLSADVMSSPCAQGPTPQPPPGNPPQPTRDPEAPPPIEEPPPPIPVPRPVVPPPIHDPPAAA